MEAALARPRPDHNKNPLEQKPATFVEQRQPVDKRVPRPVAPVDPEDLSRPTYEQRVRAILADLDANSKALRRGSLLKLSSR